MKEAKKKNNKTNFFLLIFGFTLLVFLLFSRPESSSAAYYPNQMPTGTIPIMLVGQSLYADVDSNGLVYGYRDSSLIVDRFWYSKKLANGQSIFTSMKYPNKLLTVNTNNDLSVQQYTQDIYTDETKIPANSRFYTKYVGIVSNRNSFLVSTSANFDYSIGYDMTSSENYFQYKPANTNNTTDGRWLLTFGQKYTTTNMLNLKVDSVAGKKYINSDIHITGSLNVSGVDTSKLTLNIGNNVYSIKDMDVTYINGKATFDVPVPLTYDKFQEGKSYSIEVSANTGFLDSYDNSQSFTVDYSVMTGSSTNKKVEAGTDFSKLNPEDFITDLKDSAGNTVKINKFVNIPDNKKVGKKNIGIEVTNGISTDTITVEFEVVDTVNPTATAVPQKIQKNSTFTSNASSLITNVADNGGADSVTYSITKIPSTDKVGYFTAEVTLNDQSNNQSVIEIPVTVYDETTPIVGNSILTGNDFDITIEDLKKGVSNSNLINLILEKSDSKAWDIVTGKEIETISVAQNDLDFSKGSYRALIRAQDSNNKIVEKTIKITVTDGYLEFSSVDTNLDFGKISVSSTEKNYNLYTDSNIAIEDSRGIDSDNWKLTAKIVTPLTYENSELKETLYYVDNSNNTFIFNNEESTIIEQSAVDKYKITNLDLKNDNSSGLYLKMLPGQGKVGNYSGVVQWSLKNAP
ncbi:hypothetical protein R6Z02_02700 [Carnobacterium maltaromaticum]|uniref:hypothetical protein n=1 Tax=Carnobacterium maltaromaticum TaxID=2751 RepID=UPI00298A422C|nr:hypothetical protein [Carnobacterium maltaromaticum]MDW5522649.1 hypothetical protein [Carnobacterium maltaromaticum]